jgi:hypothetical protein
VHSRDHMSARRRPARRMPCFTLNTWSGNTDSSMHPAVCVRLDNANARLA